MAVTSWGLVTLAAALALWPQGADEPAHIFGETAVDQYLQVTLTDEHLRIQVDTDYAELPGARLRQQFDRNGNGLLEEDELLLWRQAALQFALRHTQVVINGQPVALRPAAAPQVDLYDFAQTGAKPVREEVHLQAALAPFLAGPAEGPDASPSTEPLFSLQVSTTYRPPSRRHVSRIFATASAQWQLRLTDGQHASDQLSYQSLRRASREGVMPEGFDPTPIYGLELSVYAADQLLPMQQAAAADGDLNQSADSPYRHWTNQLGEALFNREQPLVWWLGIFLAFFYGMGHALAPGHGKALISAWLLGRRGTVKDALVAGLAATMTHTVMVFALGLGFTLFRIFTVDHLEALDGWITLAAGLIILGMGLWLAQRALSKSGHHHHHGHEHTHDHAHDHAHGHHHHHGHRQAGMVGALAGLAPCPAGILIVVFAASQSAPALGLFYAFIFSLGMASVLVAIAMAVSLGLRLSLGQHPRTQRILAMAPLFSSTIVALLGFWLAADAAARLGLVG